MVPAPLSGVATEFFSYISPAIAVDPNVDLNSLSMQLHGSTDDYYLSTGVINGSPLTLHQDNAAQTALNFPATGTHHFAAGSPPMSGWRHGVNYIFARTENRHANYHFTGNPTGFVGKYTLTATCSATTPYPAVPADHPLALGLGALALAGLAGLKLRPRKA